MQPGELLQGSVREPPEVFVSSATSFITPFANADAAATIELVCGDSIDGTFAGVNASWTWNGTHFDKYNASRFGEGWDGYIQWARNVNTTEGNYSNGTTQVGVGKTLSKFSK